MFKAGSFWIFFQRVIQFKKEKRHDILGVKNIFIM